MSIMVFQKKHMRGPAGNNISSTPKFFGAGPAAAGRGFTILEMLVAMAVLGVIITIGVGLLVIFSSLQRRTINAQNAMDSVRFAVDTMARDMRTGDNYCEEADCSEDDGSTPNPTCSWSGGGCAVFSFRQRLSGNETVRYRRRNGVVETWRTSRPAWLPLTDPQRTVTNLRFYVQGVGTATPDEEQERITIVMEVQGGQGSKVDELVVTRAQTTVTKRKLQ